MAFSNIDFQSVTALFSKLVDIIIVAIESYKTWKKEQEAKKIKEDAVSSFLEMFNPAKKK